VARRAESRGAESRGAARRDAPRHCAAQHCAARHRAASLGFMRRDCSAPDQFPVSLLSHARRCLAPPFLSLAPVPAHALPAQYLAARRAAVQAQPKLLDVRNFSLENLEGVKAPANSAMR